MHVLRQKCFLLTYIFSQLFPAIVLWLKCIGIGMKSYMILMTWQEPRSRFSLMSSSCGASTLRIFIWDRGLFQTFLSFSFQTHQIAFYDFMLTSYKSTRSKYVQSFLQAAKVILSISIHFDIEFYAYQRESMSCSIFNEGFNEILKNPQTYNF